MEVSASKRLQAVYIPIPFCGSIVKSPPTCALKPRPLKPRNCSVLTPLAILPSSLPLIRPSSPTKTRLLSFKSEAFAQFPVNRTWKSPAAMAGTAISTPESRGKLLVFDNEEDLSVALAKYTADLSEKFVKERGVFTVVLSGGSLIESLRKLVESPYVDSIEWSKWHVFWLDERVVPKDHVDSNYKLAYDGFLSKVPILNGHVYAINDALSAEGAAEDYEACLRRLVKTNIIDMSTATGFPKFDLMLLGMGPDGHVASLFPGHPLVNENQKWVTFIKDSPKPPPQRITFTFPVINSSAAIALVVTGASLAGAVQTAFGNQQNSVSLPVQMVSPEGELTWFADKAATSKLQDEASP